MTIIPLTLVLGFWAVWISNHAVHRAIMDKEERANDALILYVLLAGTLISGLVCCIA
jgi:hypothetical protein